MGICVRLMSSSRGSSSSSSSSSATLAPRVNHTPPAPKAYPLQHNHTSTITTRIADASRVTMTSHVTVPSHVTHATATSRDTCHCTGRSRRNGHRQLLWRQIDQAVALDCEVGDRHAPSLPDEGCDALHFGGRDAYELACGGGERREGSECVRCDV